MNRPRKHSATLLCAALSLAAAPARAANPQPFPTVRVSPERVEMAAFYAGSDMRVEGMASPGAKVIVVLRGPDTKEAFNRKGRLGPLWINIGKVNISKVPSLFLCFTPENVRTMVPRSEIERYQLTEGTMHRQMKVEPAKLDHEDIRAAFLKLKIEQRQYAVVNGAVKMGEPTAEGTPYSVSFHWPRRALPDSYQIRVYECRNGAITAQSSLPLEVVRAGFPSTINYLASDRPGLYGIIAVIAAILAGFGIDFIASRLPKKRGLPAEERKPAAQTARGSAH